MTKLYFTLTLPIFVPRRGTNLQTLGIFQFYQILRRSAEANADSDESLLGQIMCATCDFDVFMMMMRETKRRADARARSAARK